MRSLWRPSSITTSGRSRMRQMRLPPDRRGCVAAVVPALHSSRSTSDKFAMGHDLVTSRYTFRLPLSQGYALFNASTGSVLRLQGVDAAELSELLSGPRTLIPHDALS